MILFYTDHPSEGSTRELPAISCQIQIIARKKKEKRKKKVQPRGTHLHPTITHVTFTGATILNIRAKVQIIDAYITASIGAMAELG